MEVTNPKVKYIFEALEKAEISIADFSKITSISRETFYRWKKGNAITDQLRLDLAYNTAVRFESACRLDYLPLVDKLKPGKRVEVIRGIVRKMAGK